MNDPGFNIAAVERDTGLSKDVLRMWERRYGFPVPARDANGERVYPAEQVERLRQIKRLMDLGHRPGKLMSLSPKELATASSRRPRVDKPTRPPEPGELAQLLSHIKRHDAEAYLQAMQQRLARQGLQVFVQDTVAPLTREVGEAWEDGRLEVFEEHLFTELTKRLLRQAVGALPAARLAPRVLLTSLPEEQHALGLLMVEALLVLEGAECVPLGTQMPLLEISRAAEAHRADIVALSFSTAFPQRQISGLLKQLRLMLPKETALWAGGGGVARLSAQEGCRLFGSLDEALAALADWRAQRG